MKDEKFSGRYSLSIDTKGRVSVPALFRDIFTQRYGENMLVLATVFDHCLRAYPMEEWKQIIEHASTLNSMDEDVKFYYRHFLSSAAHLSWDKQGRILLPASHKEWAEINSGQVLFIGFSSRIEIWDKAVYESKMAVADIVSVAKSMKEQGARI